MALCRRLLEQCCTQLQRLDPHGVEKRLVAEVDPSLEVGGRDAPQEIMQLLMLFLRSALLLPLFSLSLLLRRLFTLLTLGLSRRLFAFPLLPQLLSLQLPLLHRRSLDCLFSIPLLAGLGSLAIHYQPRLLLLCSEAPEAFALRSPSPSQRRIPCVSPREQRAGSGLGKRL